MAGVTYDSSFWTKEDETDGESGLDESCEESENESESDVSEDTVSVMSSDEEDQLDVLLLGEDINEDELDTEYIPSQASTMSSVDSQVSGISEDPLARPDMEWKDQNCVDTDAPDPRTQAFNPVRHPGIQINSFRRSARTNFMTPINFFRLFFTDQILQLICDATNACAEFNHLKGRNKSYFTGPGKTWPSLTVQELLRFFGLLIFMSYFKLPTLARYWSQKPMYKGIIVPNIMVRLRFKAVLSFLQVVPQENINRENKLSKVQPLLDHIKTMSKQYFQPYRSICVDERMLPSKHQSGLKQFMRNKPVRFGFKLWVLACSTTGYTFDFNVYLGRSGPALNNPHYGLAYNVVFDLVYNFFHQGYHLFIDNFFTTDKLVLDLLRKGLYTIGTVKSNSSAMPPVFKDRNTWAKCCRRGDFRWVRVGPYVVIQWKDSTTVTVLSTVHSGDSVSVCKRKMKVRNRWSKKTITQPTAVRDYNKGMVGVDQSDQNLSKYPTHLKTLANWWKLFLFHSIDIAIVNAFILFKEYAVKFLNNPIPSSYGQIEFREALVESLCKFDLMDMTDEDDDNKINCLPEVLMHRYQCKLCYAEARLHGNQPSKIKTTFGCEGCRVPLCITRERNCFARWHSPEGKQFRDWIMQNQRKKDNP